MSPEWQQPNNPLRIRYKVEQPLEAGGSLMYFIPILAFRVVDDQMDFLTINGTIIPALSRNVMYTDILLNGEWMHLS